MVVYRYGHGLYVVIDREIYGRKHGIMDVKRCDLMHLSLTFLSQDWKIATHQSRAYIRRNYSFKLVLPSGGHTSPHDEQHTRHRNQPKVKVKSQRVFRPICASTRT